MHSYKTRVKPYPLIGRCMTTPPMYVCMSVCINMEFDYACLHNINCKQWEVNKKLVTSCGECMVRGRKDTCALPKLHMLNTIWCTQWPHLIGECYNTVWVHGCTYMAVVPLLRYQIWIVSLTFVSLSPTVSNRRARVIRIIFNALIFS